jgi:hypothetical protein
MVRSKKTNKRKKVQRGGSLLGISDPKVLKQIFEKYKKKDKTPDMDFIEYLQDHSTKFKDLNEINDEYTAYNTAYNTAKKIIEGSIIYHTGKAANQEAAKASKAKKAAAVASKQAEEAEKAELGEEIEKIKMSKYVSGSFPGGLDVFKLTKYKDIFKLGTSDKFREYFSGDILNDNFRGAITLLNENKHLLDPQSQDPDHDGFFNLFIATAEYMAKCIEKDYGVNPDNIDNFKRLLRENKLPYLDGWLFNNAWYEVAGEEDVLDIKKVIEVIINILKNSGFPANRSTMRLNTVKNKENETKTLNDWLSDELKIFWVNIILDTDTMFNKADIKNWWMRSHTARDIRGELGGGAKSKRSKKSRKVKRSKKSRKVIKSRKVKKSRKSRRK